MKKDYETFKQTSTDDITSLKSVTSTLRSDVTALQTSVNTLTEKTAALDTTITSMQNAFNSIETSFETVKQTVNELAEKIKNLDGEYLRLDGTNSPTADIDWNSKKLTNAYIYDRVDYKGEIDTYAEFIVNPNAGNDGTDFIAISHNGEKILTCDGLYIELYKYVYNFGQSRWFASTVDYHKNVTINSRFIYVQNEFDSSLGITADQLFFGSGNEFFSTKHLSELSLLTSTGTNTLKALSLSTYSLITDSNYHIDDDYALTTKQYVDSLAPTAMTDTEVSEITVLFA